MGCAGSKLTHETVTPKTATLSALRSEVTRARKLGTPDETFEELLAIKEELCVTYIAIQPLRASCHMHPISEIPWRLNFRTQPRRAGC